MKIKKKVVTKLLEQYLSDVGFPDDGFELLASCTVNRGFSADVNAFCEGAQRLIEEWDLVSGDFADEVQDVYPDLRVSVVVRDVSYSTDDVDDVGGEIFRTTGSISDSVDSDDDDDPDSDVDQYEEEGLSIADDGDLVYYVEEDSSEDTNIDDLTLKDVLQQLDDSIDTYIPSEEDLEEFGFYDDEEDRRYY